MSGMDDSFVAACIQMNSGADVQDNLERAEALLAQAAESGARLAALPEFFSLMSADETLKLAAAEADGEGPAQDLLARAARRHCMYIAGGTLPVAAPDGRVFSACMLFAPDGSRIARYDKIHLFRFDGEDGRIDESRTIAPGRQPAAADTPLGRIGLSVCYDLRFPELFRRLGADIILAPSAFTRETGAAHWKVLLRARAIENMAHVIAPAQAGEHPGGRTTFGSSMIIDAWGEVLAAADSGGEEVILAEINAGDRRRQREKLPALQHREIE